MLPIFGLLLYWNIRILPRHYFRILLNFVLYPPFISLFSAFISFPHSHVFVLFIITFPLSIVFCQIKLTSNKNVIIICDIFANNMPWHVPKIAIGYFSILNQTNSQRKFTFKLNFPLYKINSYYKVFILSLLISNF